MSARYEFGPFRLDPQERLLLRGGQPVSLPPKAFDLLMLFVQAPGRLLEKRTLMQALWPDTFVEESNLAYNVSVIRKALGDGLDDQQIVATVPTRGYRFVAQVRQVHDADAPVAPKRRLSATPVVWAVLLGIGVVALAVAIVTFRDVRRDVSARAQGATRFPLLPPPGAAFGTAPADPHLAVSPDGRSIAFIASRADVAGGLWVRDLGAVEARLLPGITGAAKPFWSPDGRSLGFFRNQELQVVPATGGPPRTLGSGVAGIGGAWSPDDVIVFAPSPADGLHRIPAGGGSATRVTIVDAERGESHRFPVFLPDGRRFLYLAVMTIPEEERRVCIASVDGREGPACIISNVDSNAMLAPSGHLLYVRGSTLLAHRFDVDRLRLDGDPVAVAEGVVPPPTNRGAPMSVGGDVLAFRSTAPRLDRLVWVDRRGRELRTAIGPGDYTSFAVSADGGRLAHNGTVAATGRRDIWVVNLATGHEERMTFDPAFDSLPLWSRDGSRLFFCSARTSMMNVYEQDLGAPGSARVVMPLPPYKYMCARDVSADGRLLLVDVPGNASNVYVLSLRDQELQPVATTSAAEHAGAFSPDGRSIAYTSNESGPEEVFVQPFPVSDERRQVSRGGGRSPRWRSDGRELFYVAPDGMLMAVPAETGRLDGPAEPLFEIHQSRPAAVDYAVSAAGDQFLVRRAVPPPQVPAVTVVMNWTRDLNP